jgi:NADH-quinone oxidoreductase subunit M
MLWLFQRVFFEKPKEGCERFRDLSVVETLTFLPVILLIIGMGIFPQVFIKKIEPTAQLYIAADTAVIAQQAASAVQPLAIVSEPQN